MILISLTQNTQVTKKTAMIFFSQIYIEVKVMIFKDLISFFFMAPRDMVLYEFFPGKNDYTFVSPPQ